MSVVTLSYLLSALFSRASMAALCSSLLYTASFLPYIVLLVLCYLIPVLTLSVFIQTTLIPSLRSKTASALAADVEHAWTLACPAWSSSPAS